MKTNRAIAWLVLAIATAALLSVAAFDDPGPQTNSERIQSLSESFACPECDGQSVAESNAAVAATIRDFIRDEVTAGSTDQQIRDALLQNYGTDVLLNPPAEGFSALVWILPVMVMVIGTAGLVYVVRSRPTGSRTATEADAALVAEARQGRADG